MFLQTLFQWLTNHLEGRVDLERKLKKVEVGGN